MNTFYRWTIRNVVRCTVILTIPLCLSLFSSCGEIKSDRSTSLTLCNPTSRLRTDEMFCLRRSDLKVPSDTLLPVLKQADGSYIPSQVDDMNQDGEWDEWAFVYTLQANEKRELTIEWVPIADYPVFEPRTNIRYGKMTSPGRVEELTFDTHGKYRLPRGAKNYPYQMDGPAWENDRIGFRHYFDGRNCRDLFGKRLPDLVLDTVGINADGCPENTYQEMRSWGCDILSAANSFGLGGLAVLLPNTLIRLGVTYKDTTDIINSTHFEIVTEGPVRSAFRLDFIGWNVANTNVDVHELVTIWAGQQGHEEEIRTSPLPEGAMLTTGIVANHCTQPYIEKSYEKQWTAMMTHDRQTVNKDYMLGMALLIPQKNLPQTFHTPDEGNGILKTWCAKLTPDAEGKYNYRVYAGWELGQPSFTERETFIQLIDDYAANLNQPIQISIHPSND